MLAGFTHPDLGTIAVRAALERAFGEPLIPSGIRAYSPPIFDAARELAAAPAKSHTLTPLLRSLVCLRAAQMVGCPF